MSVHQSPPLDPERAAWLSARNAALVAATPRLAALRTRLLAVAGHEVAFIQAERHVEELLARGTWRVGTRVRLQLGAPHACHTNAALAWCADPDGVVLETGYALAEDGVWVSHSWIRRRGRLEESTARRAGYFGVRLTAVESVRFALANTEASLVAAALTRRPAWTATVRSYLDALQTDTGPLVPPSASRSRRPR